jgi:tape measure domain-containing protein
MADKKTLELEIKIAAQEAQRVVSSMSEDIRTLTAQAKLLTGDSSSLSSQLQTLQAAASRTANSFKLFGANTEEIRSLQQQLKKAALDLTDQGFDPQSEEVQNLVRQYKTLDEQAGNVQASQGGLLGILGKIKTEAGSLAVVIAAIKVDQAVASAAGYMLDQADAIQTVKNNFGIMLNDMQAGAALAEEINSFNVKTPFNLEQVTQATQVLYTAKVSLKDMQEYLTRFGDLAKGDAQQFGSFTQAYAQSAAKGKADLEILNRYTDQGVPILDALAKKLNTTTENIVDMSSKGKISFKDLTDAIKMMTDEGGGYYGTMELASQSWASAQAGLKEATNSLSASVAQTLMPAAQAAVAVLTSIVNTINASPLFKGLLAAAVTALVIIINTKMIVAVVGLITKIWAAYAAQTALNGALAVTNPLMLAGIAAATAAAGAAVYFATKQQKAAESTNAATLQMLQQKETIDQLVQSLHDYSDAALGFNVDQMTQSLSAAKKNLADLQAQAATASQYNPSSFTVAGNGKEGTSQYDDLMKKIEQQQKDIADMEAALAAYRHEQTTRAAKSFADSLHNAAPAFESDWSSKLPQVNQYAALQAERLKAEETLNEAALKSYGIQFNTQKKYIEEKSALTQYYDNKEAELRQSIQDKQLSDYQKKASDIIKSLQDAADTAAMQGNWSGAASNTVKSAVLSGASNTEAGQVAQGAMQGGLMGAAMAALKALIGAIINAISALENGKKALNFITTIVDKIFDVIGSLVNEALGPAIRFFETFGTTVGKIIKPLAAVAAQIAEVEPILNIVTQLLEWIGNLFSVLYGITKPFLDIIKNAYNWFIDFINSVFHTSFKKIGEDAEDTADALEEAEDKIKALYQEQIDLVNDQLNAQLQSLQTQYELGLMTRQEYNTKAAAYTSTADDEITSLTKEMNEKLAAIQEDTDDIADAIADKISEAIGDSATDIGLGILTGGIYTLGHAFGWWDVGATRISADQFGMVHKDETIIPKTFADGIRSGEMSLVGGEGSSSGKTIISVSLNVEGSVLTKNELIDDVYDGLALGVKSGRYTGVAAA